VDALAEQIEYYRQRADEYDEWWFRQGRYAMEPAEQARWFADQVEVERALNSFQPDGDVLELACGTGLWTRHLIRYANRVTAVDAAPEMISRNRTRVDDRAPVQYVTADLFRWRPPARSYDVCFFGYWLSHVPADRLTGFWEVVATAVRPAGRVSLWTAPGQPTPAPNGSPGNSTTVGVSTSSNGFGTRTTWLRPRGGSGDGHCPPATPSTG
jgi:SAM-dependent methyltransferase